MVDREFRADARARPGLRARRSRPWLSARLPAAITVLGPTFDPDELAARKLLALFNRAMPRDFADVFVVTRSRAPQELLDVARELDPGLETAVLAVAMRCLSAYRDEDIPIDPARLPEVRAFLDA